MSAAQRAAFLAAFPQIDRDYDTGGGCKAWHLPLPGGKYILITDDGGAEPPTDEDRQIMVGRYFEDGDPLDDCDLLTWEEATEYLRRSLAEGATPAAAQVAQPKGAQPIGGLKAEHRPRHREIELWSTDAAGKCVARVLHVGYLDDHGRDFFLQLFTLIAASPDLLQCCQLVRMSNGWRYLAQESRDLIDAAIAKANEVRR